MHFDNPNDISCNEICSNLSLQNLSTIVTDDTEQTQFSCNIIREEARPPIQINSEIPFKHRGIHVVNLNTRHVKPKLDELKIMFENNKCIDVFGICETFLNETVDDKLLREADCKHRALAHNNVESRKLWIWLKFWEIDLYHACLRFTSF